MYNENGKKARWKVGPKNRDYLYYKGDDGEDVLMRSLYDGEKHVFMKVLIENTEEELAEGKMDLYVYNYIGNYGNPMFGGMGMPGNFFMCNGFMSLMKMYVNYVSPGNYVFCLRNKGKLYKVWKRSDFKKYPELLDKGLYKRMRRSKDSEKIMLEYFSKYNDNISKTVL
ncbi:MAG: hypothetical protein HRT66_01295 [Flavobacteriaceae bacterium]|nr:hypothetical protein [Flavobacteriaceae bacterium]